MIDLKFPPEAEISPLGLTRAQAAKVLGVAEQTLRDWEREGRGPSVVRLSERLAVYPRNAIVEFITANTKTARHIAAR